jgi:hypothetical protein
VQGIEDIYGAGEKRRMDFVRSPEGGKPLGRPRHRWENNSKMDCIGTTWQAVAYRWSTFRFHKLCRMTSLAEDPAEYQEDL